MMEKTVYLPFYMTYPVKYPYNQENKAARDIEYLREMYPTEAKRLLSRISEILDRMDYEESMIYDEYPDRWQLYRLAESIVRILKNEAEQSGEEIIPEKWEWISDMVQVLLFDEIFNRRHGNNHGSRRSQIFVDREKWRMPYGSGRTQGMSGGNMGSREMPGNMNENDMRNREMQEMMDENNVRNREMQEMMDENNTRNREMSERMNENDMRNREMQEMMDENSMGNREQ